MTQTTTLVIEHEDDLGQFVDASVEALLSDAGERNVSVEEKTQEDITLETLDSLKEYYMLGGDEFADISQTCHYLKTKEPVNE